LNPYPDRYSPAFAFSTIPYPLSQQLAPACSFGVLSEQARSRAYHVPCNADAGLDHLPRPTV